MRASRLRPLRIAAAALALLALPSLAAPALARQFQMSGTWLMRQGRVFLPLQGAVPQGNPTTLLVPFASMGSWTEAPLTTGGMLDQAQVVHGAGRVSATMNSIGPVLAHLKSGKLRALGVASPKRSPALPDLPTIAESGVPGFEAGSWMGLLAPAKTPPKIIARVNAAAVKAVHSPDTNARLVSLGAVPVGDSPKEFAARIRREWQGMAKVVKTAGVRIE